MRQAGRAQSAQDDAVSQCTKSPRAGRDGRYAGSLENRTRFIRNVLAKLRAEFGPGLTICMRLGCFDSVQHSIPIYVCFMHNRSSSSANIS